MAKADWSLGQFRAVLVLVETAGRLRWNSAQQRTGGGYTRLVVSEIKKEIPKCKCLL